MGTSRLGGSGGGGGGGASGYGPRRHLLRRQTSGFRHQSSVCPAFPEPNESNFLKMGRGEKKINYFFFFFFFFWVGVFDGLMMIKKFGEVCDITELSL